MNKKGFTLIEVLGVVIIIGVLLAILVSIVDEDLNYTKTFASEYQVRLIEESATLYYQNYKSEIPTIDVDKITTITVQTLYDKGFIKDKDLKINDKVSIDKTDIVALYLIDEEINSLYDKDQTTIPKIILKGPIELKIGLNGSYYEYGAVVINTDTITINDLAPANISGTVNVSAEGEYNIYYNYSGASTVTRKVIVEETTAKVDTTKPVITLIGSSTISLTVGSTYTEQGATASDDKDGNISARITMSGSVDTSKKGTYYKYYDVSDVSGNKALTVVRTINVN